MPANFPEIWESRVRTNLTTADAAPWMEGIAELDADVTTLGMGTESEQNVIHVPVSTFEPDVLINNTTYPLAIQAYSDTESLVTLDKYQTLATSISDDQAAGASYDRIDAATKSHTKKILKTKNAKAIHAMAPASHTANTPVLKTTGALVGGRRRLIYDDLVNLKAAFDKMECPAEDRRLVLCSDHVQDILLDRQNFGNLIINYNAGKPLGTIAGFEIFEYVANPYYTTGGTVKMAWGAAPSGTDFRASVAFYKENVAKKTGITKQYFDKANTTTQTNLVNYRHYFIMMPIMNKYIGAITSATS